MKSQVTKTDTPQGVKTPSVLDPLNTPIIRTCVLNLIAQIALGTPMAAQSATKFSPLSDGSTERDCPQGLPRFNGKQRRP